MENIHTLELSELEGLKLDYQDGPNIITGVLKSRRGAWLSSGSEGDTNRDANQAVTFHEAWRAGVVSSPTLFSPPLPTPCPLGLG